MGTEMRDGDVASDPVAERKAAQRRFEELPALSVARFAARLCDQIKKQQLDFAWFLGAGCSVSSGILPASWLVRQWIDDLHKDYLRDNPTAGAHDEWASIEFGPLAVSEPAALYSAIIKRKFHTEVERQTAIEHLCSDKRPGVGYLILAQLITHGGYGARWNTVLTTNFDELLADAIYAIGTSKARPQVISHQLLAPHIRLRADRPTIVKVHGDHMLGARNTADEIAGMGRPMESRLNRILDQRGLIILGYSGFDTGIKRFLVQSRINHPIYWVGAAAPSPGIVKWLHENNAQRVAWPDGHVRSAEGHVDFDATLSELSRIFELEEVTEASLARAFDARKDELIEHVRRLTASKPGKVATSAGSEPKTDQEVERVFGSLLGPDVRAAMEAYRYSKTNPEKAEQLYRSAIEAHPESAILLGDYAVFQTTIRNNVEIADELFNRAIRADSDNADILGNYAVFLNDVQGDHVSAEEYFERALDADPKHANNLGNYAIFLQNERERFEAANDLYKRAIDADPKRSIVLSAYANFQWKVRGNPLAAEDLYKRAIDADQEDANYCANYAQFLLARGRTENGVSMIERAFQLLPKENPPKDLLVELLFYIYAHMPWADGALGRMKTLVAEGARSLNWVFKPTIDRAIADGHPEPELLKQLSAVVSKDADAATLDQFPAWQEA
jgi:Tfp pilus assembly protein PilF